jgi:hypothetical protein
MAMPLQQFIDYQNAVARQRQDRIDVHAQAIAAAGAQRPLNILADGDSWFDYPLNGYVPDPTDVIARLRLQMPDALILNLAHAGDATTQILGVDKYNRLRGLLQDHATHGKFDAILFSGGGDDLCGDQFRFWLNDAAKVNNDPAQAINEEALKDILGVVETAYRDVAALRNLGGDPAVPIFTHGYDFAIPNNQGVCTLGPWLYPSLHSRGWMNSMADLPVGKQIVRTMLGRFDQLMKDLEAEPVLNIVYVRTQGTLTRDDQWANELHPTPQGFDLIAARFAQAIGGRL